MMTAYFGNSICTEFPALVIRNGKLNTDVYYLTANPKKPKKEGIVYEFENYCNVMKKTC